MEQININRCGEGENTCKCSKPQDCGYLYSDDEDDNGMFHFCPNCDREYDEIDYDFQICSRCHFDAEKSEFVDENELPE